MINNLEPKKIDGKPMKSLSDLEKLWHNLDISAGDTLIVHSSLKSLGYVIGGAEAVIQSLMNVVGSKGNIIMPTQTVELSDPSTWEYPPVDKNYWDFIRINQIPYNPETTPVSKGIGIVPETFRKYPNVIRSSHPLYSFAIYGKNKKELVQQSLDYGLGLDSPLGYLFSHKMPAKILFIGTNFESNTSIHLAEHFLDRSPFEQEVYILQNGVNTLVKFKDIELDKDDDFLEIQQEYLQKYSVPSEVIYQGKAEVYDFQKVISTAKEHFGTDIMK